MQISTVAVMGAGAVGAYLVWGLSEKLGDNLCLVADGVRAERLRRDGLWINGQNYKPLVKTPDEAKGVDVLFVTTKYGALLEALDDIVKVVDDHTLVISLLNGVDSEDIIGARIDRRQILPALIKIASERVDNRILFSPETTVGIIYGEEEPNRGSEHPAAVSELFSGTGIHYRETDVIKSEIWSKFAINIRDNQPQAMIGCGAGAYEDSEHMAFFRQALNKEVETIAAAKGIDMSLAAQSSGKSSPVSKRARFSTLQDLDAKRHTEVDMFAGAMVRMGKELGIPTPYNEFMYHAIKALEEKNDGRFDY